MAKARKKPASKRKATRKSRSAAHDFMLSLGGVAALCFIWCAFGIAVANPTQKLQAPRMQVASLPKEPPPPQPVIIWRPEKMAPVKQLAYQAAERKGMPPALVHGVVKAESAEQPHAVSKAGACGLMQLMPQTARHLGVRDCHNAKENVEGGTRYLSELTERYGSYTIALIAYNWGPANTDRWLERGGRWSQLPRETRDYISKVKLNEALSLRESRLALNME